MRNVLDLIINGGLVQRYHTLPTIAGETVGHHSFIVAWLTHLLTPTDVRAELLLAALQHDLAEAVTGDLPSPTKRRLGISAQFAAYEDDVLENSNHQNWGAELTSEEARTLKLADRLAGMLHCLHEHRLGNRYTTGAYFNFMAYAEELKPFSVVEEELFAYLKGQWYERK